MYLNGKKIETGIAELDVSMGENNLRQDRDQIEWWYRSKPQGTATITLNKDSTTKLLEIIKSREVAEKEREEVYKYQRILRRTKKHRIRKKQVKKILNALINSKELLNFYSIYIGGGFKDEKNKIR